VEKHIKGEHTLLPEIIVKYNRVLTTRLELSHIVAYYPRLSALCWSSHEKNILSIDILRVDVFEGIHEFLEISIEVLFLEEWKIKLTSLCLLLL